MKLWSRLQNYLQSPPTTISNTTQNSAGSSTTINKPITSGTSLASQAAAAQANQQLIGSGLSGTIGGLSGAGSVGNGASNNWTYYTGSTYVLQTFDIKECVEVDTLEALNWGVAITDLGYKYYNLLSISGQQNTIIYMANLDTSIRNLYPMCYVHKDTYKKYLCKVIRVFYSNFYPKELL